jgi:autotransporter-associated beta strand protein
LTFATGQGGSEINVDAMAGLLTINSASIVNSAGNNANNLNLQGSASGIWNGILADGPQLLNVLKRGVGVWTLGGANTYTGTTTVSGGTLLINGQVGAGAVTAQSGATLGGIGGTIAGPVTVMGGALLSTYALGTNILTINNSLTLQPGSTTLVEINKTAGTCDKVVGLTSLAYGGTLAVQNLAGTLTTSDSFPLFTSAAYTGAFTTITPATPGVGLAWDTSTLATDGVLRIAPGNIVSTVPTNITFSVMGGSTMQFSWPTNHTGWTLQSNSANIAVEADWIAVAGSSQTNAVSISIDKSQKAVFFRLVYP